MTTKTLSQPAQDTIDHYLHFKIGQAECAVPYFNNKRGAKRAGLRATIGKGSYKEIFEETEILGLRQKINRDAWTSELLKKFMCNQNIGIDCSGLAYYILASENKARGNGSINRHLTFSDVGFIRRLIAKFRPVENTSVLTLAHEKNSIPVDLKNIQPGDFITMIGNQENKFGERNHILVVHAVEQENSTLKIIHYTNSIAWPEDGEYGHGVRQGTIEITDLSKSLLEQKWVEKDKLGQENPTYTRAKISKTEIRRLKWW